MKNRDMFYQTTQQGYSNPGMFIPPSGYNINTEYQAYGPNMLPNQMPNTIPQANTTNNYYDNNGYNDYEDRISRLERQVKNLDNRLQKLENASIDNNTDNFYMI